MKQLLKFPLFVILGIVGLTPFSVHSSNLGPVALSDSQVAQYPFNTAGLVIASEGWTGSAAAVGNRAALSCAHVIFDPDTNQVSPSIFRYLPQNNNPSQAEASFSTATANSKPVLSKIYFDDYGAAAQQDGTSDASFNRDFTILLFAEDLGQQVAAYGQNSATTNALYNIVGYPADEKLIPLSNIYKMHGTNGTEGNFDTPQRLNPNESRVIESKLYTSGGNSGGPVFRFANGVTELVGILVGGPADIEGEKFSIWTEIDEVIYNAIANFAANPDQIDQGISSTVAMSISGGGGGGGNSGAGDTPPAAGDANDTPEGATVITIGSTIGGNFSSAEDLDYFKFYLPAQGEFVVYTTGDSDTYGILANAEGQILSETDTGGNDALGLNFRITASGEAGWYFVEVSSGDGSVGSYSLGVNKSVDPSQDTNNGILQSESLEMPIFDQPGESLFATWSGNYVEATLHEADSDFYTFNVAAYGTVLILTYGEIDTAAVLYDANLGIIREVDDSILGEDAFMELLLEPGSYTLEVKASNGLASGEYGLEVRQFPNVGRFPTPDPDDTFGEAFLIEERDYLSANRTSLSGIMNAGGTKDFHIIELEQAASIVINFTNAFGQAAYLNLFDEELIPVGQALSNGAGTTLSATDLYEGYYVLRVEVPAVSETVSYQIDMIIDGQGSVGGENSLAEGYYIIRSSSDSSVLGADPESNLVGLVDLDPGEEVEWAIQSIGNGLYVIQSDTTDKYLEVAGSSLSDNASVVQNDWIGNGNQLWKILRNPDGSYQILASHSDKALSVSSEFLTIQQTYRGDASQRWSLQFTEALVFEE